MKKLAIVFVGLVFVLTACSGRLEQDPLAGMTGEVRNTLPPKPPIGAPKPVQSDAVKVDSSSKRYTFQEGVPGDFRVTARALLQGYEASVSIPNLDLFPGAQFIETDGKFMWTPPLGYIESGSEVILALKVFGVAAPTPGTKGDLLSHEEVIEIRVTKQFSQPVINRAETPTAGIREREWAEIKIFVTDLDGGVDPAEFPQLLLLPPTGSLGNLAPYLSIRSVRRGTAPKTWEFVLRADLQGAELVTQSMEFGFGVQVASQFLKKSPVTQYKVNILNSPLPPVADWTGPFEFDVGRYAAIPFKVFDVRGESRLELVTRDAGNGQPPVPVGTLPEGARVVCRSLSEDVMQCEMRWTPPENLAGHVDGVRLKVKSQNKTVGDNYSIESWLDLTYKVRPRPQIPASNGGAR